MFLAINNTIKNLVQFLIVFLPTILFVLIIAHHTIRGFRRGYRKSIKLFIHSIVLVVIFVSLFLILVETTFGDKLLLSIVNLFLGGEGALQTRLGVSTDVVLLREVLIKGLPNNLGEVEGLASAISTIVEGSSGYIEVLVNYIYRLLFALVFFILYQIFDFLSFIIFAIFNNNKKAKKKQAKRFREGKEYSTFRNERLGGSLVGLTRGVIKALVFISFVGAFFFMLSGDEGNGTLKSMDLGDENINDVYSMYQQLDSYGSNGVFKALNLFQDDEKGPVYLIVADTLNSGKVKKIDPNTGVETVYKMNLRDGVASYTSFAKELINLVGKHSEEDIRKYFSGEIDANELINRAFTMVTNDPEVQTDMLILINDLPLNTYTFNLALSLVDSAASSIESLNLNFSDELLEPIYILLSSGYYSNTIQEEKELKELGATETLPHLKVTDLLDKDDIKVIAEIGLIILNSDVQLQGGIENINELLPTIKQLVAYIERLAIFSKASTRNSINPTIARLYNYIESAYLNSGVLSLDGEGGLSLLSDDAEDYHLKLDSYLQSLNEDIDWIGEVEFLLDAVDDISKIYLNVTSIETDDITEVIFSIFDPENEHYTENQQIIDRLCSHIYDSKMLGRVLSTGFIYDLLSSVLIGIAPGYELPRDINYANVYDSNGNRTATGELYYLIKAIKLSFNAFDIKGIFNMIEDPEGMDTINLLKIIADGLVKEDEVDHSSITDYLIDSTIIESFLSYYLIQMSETEGSIIYITKQARALDSNGGYTNIIKKDMLKELLDIIPELVIDTEENESLLTILKPLISPPEGEEVDTMKVIDNLLNHPLFERILNNKIIQGLIANFIIPVLDGEVDAVVIPKALKDPENWVSTNNKDSEIICLLNSLKLLKIDYSTLFGENSEGESDLLSNVFGSLIQLATGDNFIDLFESDIIYYTVSNVLTSLDFSNEGEEASFELIIPNSSRKLLIDESIDYVVMKDDLCNLVKSIIMLFDIDSEDPSFDNFTEKFNDLDSLFNNLMKNKEKLLTSNIISASLAYALNNTLSSNESSDGQLLSIPNDLKRDATKDSLKGYSKSNGWYSELRNLMNALNEIFGESVSFEDSEVDTKLTGLLKDKGYRAPSISDPSRSVIDVLLSSRIVSSTITQVIDSVLLNEEAPLINKKVADSCKDGGIYSKVELLSLLDLLDQYGLDLGAEEFKLEIKQIKPIEDFDNEKKQFKLVRALLTYFLFGDKTDPDQYDVTSDPESEDETLLIPHKLAFESDSLKILKKSEINSIIEILGGIEDVNTWSPLDKKYKEYVKYIYDENGITKSYLIVSTISSFICSTEGIVVPKSVIDTKSGSNKIIRPTELAKLLSIIDDYIDDQGYVKEFGIDDIIVQKEVFDSDILNATICSNLKFEGNVSGGTQEVLDTYSYESRVNINEDINGEPIFYMVEEEYTALIAALKEVFEENGLNISGCDMDWLCGLTEEKIDCLLACSMTHILMSCILSDDLGDGSILDKYNSIIELRDEELTPSLSSEYLIKLAVQNAIKSTEAATWEKIEDEDMIYENVYSFKDGLRIIGFPILSREQILILRSHFSNLSEVLSAIDDVQSGLS